MDMPNLNTLAMLGEVGKTVFENLGIDTRTAFDKAFKENEHLPATERFSKAMSATQEEVLTKAPVWMRINMLSHKISNAKESGVPESDIDWDKINYYLTTNTSEGDFNNFDEIRSYDDFYEAANNMIMAQVDLASWRRVVCKDCGKTFYLGQGEIQSYLKKNLSIPKRCRSCRDKRKGIYHEETKKPSKTTATAKTNTPTAMEIALRRAGVIK